MKARVFIPALLSLLLTGCAAENPVAPPPLPAWLTTLIKDLEAAPAANPPAFVARYQYKGETVYFVPPRCCDLWSDLYRADGTILCHPNGGFNGTGDGKCPGFFSERKDEAIVWRDPRGRR